MLRSASANTPAINSRRLLLIVWAFVAMVVGLLTYATIGFGLMSGARAYAGAEGLWSKSQKDAVLALSRYVLESKPEDYQAFQEALQVTLGDRKARLELEKPDPNLQIAMQGFLQGRNHPDDVVGMVHLYRRFRNVPELDKAIGIWASADALIDQLLQLGNTVHTATLNVRMDEPNRRKFLAQLADLNAQLTPLEDDFSHLLGEISRKSGKVIRWIMVLVVAVLLAIAYFVSRRTVQQNEKFHQSLVDSEDQLRILLQFAPLPIIIIGLPESRVTYANARALDQFKVNETQLHELAVEDFYVDKAQRDLVLAELQTQGSVREREIQLQDKAGNRFWVLMSSQRLRVSDRECILTALNNVDDRRQAQEKLQHRAFHDELTSLPNRAMFMDTLSRTLHRAERKGSSFSVLFIDLDHFKDVNDTYGHSAGDLLLQGVASRVRMCVREGDLVARLGGDEFVVLIEDGQSQDEVASIAKKLQTMLEPPHSLGGKDVQVTASIGISSYPQNGTKVDELLRNADSAMYKVKSAGRNNFQFHA